MIPIQNLKNSTNKVNEIFQSAVSEAIGVQSEILTPEFLLLSLIETKNSIIIKIAKELNLNVKSTKEGIINDITDIIDSKFSGDSSSSSRKDGIYVSPDVISLMDRAEYEKNSLGDIYISSAALFLALFEPRLTDIKRVFVSNGLKYDEVKKVILNLRTHHRINSKEEESGHTILEQYTTDITALARRNELDPVINRESETARLIEILSRRKKNNPLLVGVPGVGKTVIIEALAQKIIEQDVPDHLLNKKILSLEIAHIIAGSKLHGEFEERIKAIIDEIIVSNGNIILFIDEVHTLVGAGRTAGNLDAANILKTSLAKGQLQCVGATTYKEYKKHIEVDRALDRRFQIIQVQEPSVHNAKQMLYGLKNYYENYHQVFYNNDAIDSAVDLSVRYIFDRSLPDKAIDLLDEVGAQKRIKFTTLPHHIRSLEIKKQKLNEEQQKYFGRQEFDKVANCQMEVLQLDEEINKEKELWQKSLNDKSKIVSKEDIAMLISQKTGIPLSNLNSEDFNKLKTIEEEISKKLIAQKHCVKIIADAIRRNRVGLKIKKSPIASFLFLGPTGVGKTELAKALATFLLGNENKIIRLDMSEYMERHESSKLIGSPPGYVGYGDGGQLTEKVKKQPYSVILIDEVEKAHPDVFNLFLQILDEGHLTDSEGEDVSFENTLIIFTSNIGSEHIISNKRDVGLSSNNKTLSNSEITEIVKGELKQYFKPEFINRLDDIVVFDKLTEENIEQIFELQYKKISKNLEKYNVQLLMSDNAKKHLIKKGFDEKFGARPLKRALEKYVENIVAQEIIDLGIYNESSILDNKIFYIELEQDKLIIKKEEVKNVVNVVLKKIEGL